MVVGIFGSLTDTWKDAGILIMFTKRKIQKGHFEENISSHVKKEHMSLI